MDPHTNPSAGGILNLNPEQVEAVQHIDGPLRIIAGPGTGKTRVIVERIAYLIENGHARPENILALTFSRKAAEEMRERLALRLKISYSSFAVSTFHSFCLSTIKDHYEDLGYHAPPTLLLSTEQWLLVRDLLKKESPVRWPNYGAVLTKDGFVQEVFDFILRAQENLHTPDTLRPIAYAAHKDWLEIIDFYRMYLDHLRQNDLVDYGGAISQTVNLLTEGSAALEDYRRRFSYILVDEYQDTNFSQDALLFRLQEGLGNICVVGDDDQAIHGFRGATVENILGFPEKYGGQTIELKKNYRSNKGIIEAAHSVIERNQHRVPKDPAPNNPGDDSLKPVEGRVFSHYADEANWIAGKIVDLAGHGHTYREIAVLFRSVKNPLAGLIYDKLRSAGIPVRLTGGTGDLYSHSLVKTVLDLMRFLAARNMNDSRVLALLLQSDLAGVSPFAVRLLKREAGRRRQSLHSYINSGAPETNADPAELEKAGLFVDAVQELMAQEIVDPAQMAFGIWSAFPFFRDLSLDQQPDYLEEITRQESLANLSRFVDDVKRFVERDPKNTIGEYLRMVEEGRFANVPLADPVDKLSDIVNIMTLHQAKGLEWDAVFMPALTEGFFPVRFSEREVADPRYLHRLTAGDLSPEEQHFEEERRLFYVGLTRAKTSCFLSYSLTSGPGKENAQPSRFFDEAMASEYAEKPQLDDDDAGPLSMHEAQVIFRRSLHSAETPQQVKGVYGLLCLEAVHPEKWWENIDETVCGAHPFPSGSLYLSASQLSTYRTCPLRYKFQSFWRLSSPASPQMSRGSFIHAALEAYHDPKVSHGAPSLERLLELLDYSWRDEEFPFKPVARQAKKKARATLEKYFGRYGEADGILAVETPFSFLLDGHTVSGRIDRIDKLAGGGLEIIDYKTGSTAMPVRDAPMDYQLGVYDLAVQGAPELKEMGQVSRVSYLYIETIGPRADGKRSYDPTPETRERLCGRIRRCSDGILAERFPAYGDILGGWGEELDAEEQEWMIRQKPCFFCEWGYLCK